MTIQFPKSIYKKEAIDAAVTAFGEIVKAKVTPRRTVYEVELECLEPEYDPIIAGEFANYCLAETAALRESGEIDVIEEG